MIYWNWFWFWDHLYIGELEWARNNRDGWMRIHRLSRKNYSTFSRVWNDSFWLVQIESRIILRLLSVFMVLTVVQFIIFIREISLRTHSANQSMRFKGTPPCPIFGVSVIKSRMNLQKYTRCIVSNSHFVRLDDSFFGLVLGFFGSSTGIITITTSTPLT